MKALMSWGGLALVLVLFVAFNILTGVALTRGRIDLTENKLYTLSDGTKNIVSNLDEPITLYFFFSKKLASTGPGSGVLAYAGRVRDLLEAFVANSGGRLQLEVADPEPYSETEEKAAAFGLTGVPVTAGGEMMYFGLAGRNKTGQEDVIEFFQPGREESLEYDIAKLIHNLANPKKKVVGVMSSLPMDGNPMARMMNPRAPAQDPWVVLEVLRESFDVRMIEPTVETLEKDLDVLVLVHPQNLSSGAQYAIDQYVLGGGKVLAFVDPWCEAQEVQSDPQNPMAAMMADRSSSLGVLGDAWGIEMSKDDIAADREMAMRLRGADGQPIEYVVYLGLSEDKGAFDEDDFTTAELKTLNVGCAGVLRAKADATTTVAPLMQTTKSSMRVPKSKVQFQAQPSELLESFQSGGERLILAARITGPARTAFPDGKPQATPAEGEEPAPPAAESLKESNGPINVIVVADADMLSDRLWVRVQEFFGSRIPIPGADNGAFFVNAVDNLSGSNDLISLRSRGRSVRPFDKVVELRREAEAKFRQKEKDLEAKLQDAQQRIDALQGNKDAASALILSPEQKAEIERFREERDKTRKDLRNVKHELNTDVQSLKTRLVITSGFVVPVLVLAAGIVVWMMRRAKMQSVRAAAARS